MYTSLPLMMGENTAILAEGCSFDWGTEGTQLEDFNLKVSKVHLLTY